MPVLRSADYRRMPWKNGGGETAEIAIHPPGASLDDFEWRISSVRVGTDGPFSVFRAVDRTLSILDGQGLRLAIGGRPPVELDRRSRPLRFPADTAADARLIDGPISDLNVMTRRGFWEHQVTPHDINGKLALTVETPLAFLFCRSGRLSVATMRETAVLSAGDAFLAEDAAGEWRLSAEEGHAATYLIELRRLQSAG